MGSIVKNKNKKMKGNAKMNKNTKNTEHRGVGRPKVEVKWPKGRFTRRDAYALNPELAELTVLNHLKANLVGKDSLLVKMDEVKEPLAKTEATKGLGKKQFVYCRRSAIEAGHRAKANLNKAKQSKMELPITENKPVETQSESQPVETQSA